MVSAEKSGRKRSMSVISFRKTTLHMMEMKVFLAGPTERTEKLWNHVQKLQKEEREKGGVLECETEVVSGLTAYGPGYISEDMKDLEQIVGLQTDKPSETCIHALWRYPYGSSGC